MTTALLPYAIALTYTYSLFHGILRGLKSGPDTKKPTHIVLRSKNKRTHTLTETVNKQFFLSNQDTLLKFGRQLQLGRILDGEISDTLIRQMCEHAPITYDIGLQTALWNDIRSSEDILHQTELAKPILPIESKEAKLKKELESLAYTNPNKMKDFFQEYDSTSIPLVSNGGIFTPCEGGSSDMECFRVWECGFAYVNPPEKLVVIGYIENDAVVMVGSQSGKVYMDKDEIVYNVADSLSDFANYGCRNDPTFFDYYLARPNDVKSLPCAAGTYKDKNITAEVPEDCRWIFDIGHDPDELEANAKEARQMYEEMADYFKPPPEVLHDYLEGEEDQIQTRVFFPQFGADYAYQEEFGPRPCQDTTHSIPFIPQFSPCTLEAKN